MIAVNNSSMNNIQNDDSFGAISQKVNQLLLDLWRCIVFAYELKSVPRSFAFTEKTFKLK